MLPMVKSLNEPRILTEREAMAAFDDLQPRFAQLLRGAAEYARNLGAIRSDAAAYCVRRSVRKKLAIYFPKSLLNSC